MLGLSALLFVAGTVLYTTVPGFFIYSYYPVPIYLLLLSSVMLAIRGNPGWPRRIMLAISGTVTAFFIVYTLFLSGLDRPALAVQAGEPFPTFTVQTSQGTMFTSTDLVGQHAALYVFYRGDWCPFCLSELTQLSVYYDEIRKKNVELFAVSVDPPEASEALRQQLKPLSLIHI